MLKQLSALLIFTCLTTPLHANLIECPDRPEELTSYSKTLFYCDRQSGEFIQEDMYLLSSMSKISSKRYKKGLLTETKTWSSSAVFKSHFLYAHFEDGSVLKTEYRPSVTERICAKEHYFPKKNNITRPERLIKKWVFSAHNNYNLEQIDHYIYKDGKKLVNTRELFNKKTEKLDKVFKFTYSDDSLDWQHPDTYSQFDANGNLLTTYAPNEFSLEYFLAGHSSQQNRKYTVAIIDSDFDISHHLLADKVYISPIEKYDERDNDNNSWVDDIMGWNHEISSPILLSPISLQHTGSPASHGTHVVSIAVEDRNDTSFIGYAGDMSSPEHLGNIERDLKKKGIRFTNMSFSFGNPRVGISAGKESVDAIEKLIINTPETLHVIASGNKGVEIDSFSNHNYPPSFRFDNILVVAALNTDKLELSEMDNYQLAYFSNFGRIHTDIAAPGTMIDGAAPGGGMIRYSGTSMASPYVLNHGVLNAISSNPKLTNKEIKEIIMKTAYIKDLDNPMPVKSGGILYPERISRVARILSNSSNLSIEEAVLQDRRNFDRNSEEQILRLSKFWKKRGIISCYKRLPTLDQSDYSSFRHRLTRQLR